MTINALENPFNQQIETIGEDKLYRRIFDMESALRLTALMTNPDHYIMKSGQSIMLPGIEEAKRIIDIFHLYPSQTHLQKITDLYHPDVISFVNAAYGTSTHPINKLIRYNAYNPETEAEITRILENYQVIGAKFGNQDSYDISNLVNTYFHVVTKAQSENDEDTFVKIPTGLRPLIQISYLSRQYRKQIVDATEDSLLELKIAETNLRARLGVVRGYALDTEA